MASYGLIGAIGGAAQGFSGALQSQLEEARQMRLEQVRTKNNQETNKMNNEQRHEMSMTQLKARDERQDALLDKSDTLSRSRTEWERGLPPTETWSVVEEGGNSYQKNSRTGELKPIGGESGRLPTSRVQEAEYLRSLGVDDEGIRDYMLGGDKDKPIMLSQTDDYGQKVGDIPHRFVDGANGERMLVPITVGEATGSAHTPGLQPNPAALQALKDNPDRAAEFEALHGFLPDGFSGSKGAPAKNATTDATTAGDKTQSTAGSRPNLSVDERAARATGDIDLASINRAGTVNRPSSLNTSGVEAQIAYQQAKVTAQSMADIPVDVLQSVLPFLTGKEAEEVQRAIASQKR